jgi:hypothetical protein
MFFRSRKYKEEHRYYLLPGMGKSNRHFHMRTVRWAVIVGIIVSAIFAGALYLVNRRF